MKRKIGDKVRIVSKLAERMVPSMSKYLGKEMTISGYEPDDDRVCHLVEDAEGWFWDETMFES